jgi:monoamine oxidase
MRARTSGRQWDEEAARLAGSEKDAEPRMDRRTLLKGMASAGGAAAVVPVTRTGRHRRGQHPRIVIVGAGLAGLRCAHVLWTTRGLASAVYEWDDRLGGRVDTLRDVFVNGQVVERCGEFISSEHRSMRRLARRFDLTLNNTDAYPRRTVDTFWTNGGRYTEAMLDADWHDFGWSLFQGPSMAHPGPLPTGTTRRRPAPSITSR